MTVVIFDQIRRGEKTMIGINGTSVAIGATEALITFGLIFAYLTIRLRSKT